MQPMKFVSALPRPPEVLLVSYILLNLIHKEKRLGQTPTPLLLKLDRLQIHKQINVKLNTYFRPAPTHSILFNLFPF